MKNKINKSDLVSSSGKMQKIIAGGTTGLMSLGLSNAAVIHFDFTDVSASDLGTSLFSNIEHASINFGNIGGIFFVNANQETTSGTPPTAPPSGSKFSLTPRDGRIVFKSVTYQSPQLRSQSGGIVSGVISAGDLISSTNTNTINSGLGAAGTSNRYIGFRTGNNYGWLRFSGSANDDVITIHDAAIEDISGNFLEAGSLVTYTIVPEPSSALLLAISTGAFLTRRRRTKANN